tara:strand:- start:3460 stop:3846 length:387 start_codon:yes stop_codon:yes gene_type:complete
VGDRAVPGHWEGDLIGGSKNSYIATLVERHSRYVMLVKVANKDTESVVSGLIKSAQRLPRELYKSLTWDRGKELADHQRLTITCFGILGRPHFSCDKSNWNFPSLIGVPIDIYRKYNWDKIPHQYKPV